VLTEPSRFDGALEHLRQASAILAPFGVPTMRKDFIVDPYQLLEARAAGAGGVLIILRMLPPQRIAELMKVAAEHELFVLLEAFDAADLALAGDLSEAARQPGGEPEDVPRQTLLVGVNCRDLQTLEVVEARFSALASLLPPRWPAVAESGVDSPAAARSACRLGYRLALIGTALMNCEAPAKLLSEILAATRTVPP
jgi:indole-3-glycerol phosphate synthase